jgi:hypothetical protein
MIPAHVKKLLQDVYGTRWGEAWLEWWLFDGKGGFIPGTRGFGRAATANPPDDRAVFWSAGLLKPGTDRADANVEGLKTFVMDDVGKVAGKSEIDPDLLEMLMPQPTSRPESSPGNEQWQWCFSDTMAEDVVTALRRSLPFQSHATAMSNLIRVPMGISGKPGIVHEVTDLGRGPVYTADEFVRLCGGLKVPVRPTRQVVASLLAPTEGAVEDILQCLPNNGTAPYCDSEPAWYNFCQALHGATGGKRLDLWQGWCAQWPHAQMRDIEGTWERQRPISSGWVTLTMYADKWGSDRGALARALFNDGVVPPEVSDVNNGDNSSRMLTVNDFRSVVGEVDFVHVGTAGFWKAASVDANVAPVDVGGLKPVKATAWMRAYRKVTELSWLPGQPRLIEGMCIGVSGLQRRAQHTIFNLYQPPVAVPSNGNAIRWIELVQRLWPLEAEEIINWFAHRVQKPGEKCNHALVLGGAPGIGKDTVIAPVRKAVGDHNCYDIMPSDLKTNFNDYMRTVMLVINELRDDGSISQYALYEKCKTLIAAPPDIVSINSKYLRPYKVPNVCGVVMTTNYLQTGLYLPASDRRHLVCWSDEPAIAAGDGRLADMWKWLEGGGHDEVAEYLRTHDISGFDPKAPPRKTAAFDEVAVASGSPEERALGDKVEKLGSPTIVRINDLKSKADDAFTDSDAAGLDDFLTSHKYRRAAAEALGRAGYKAVPNPSRQDGRWIIGGKPETVYGRKGMGVEELRALARKLSAVGDSGGGNA